MTSRSGLAHRVVALIDLTDLADDRRVDGIDGLVERAARHGCPAVCVWPDHVARCAELVARHGSAAPLVATVVNFPSGEAPLEAVVAETERATADGADEIDLVLPRGALGAGDEGPARAVVSSVAAIVHRAGRHLKVILETGELADAEAVRRAARVAVEEGADFVKTSTGKTATGATVGAVEAMIDVIEGAGRTVGLKPSGGIRTLDDAAALLDVVDRRLGPSWASAETFRFGASGLLDAALAEL
ncbi:deoxyribose-phosphate aldolase [Ilumatobacter sp.]|uniref:deoxyribose-phosphate aldolase n=1 Tax=Ilumatobacter sp. TaxID=1967498 RepID=UPI003B51FBB9